MGRKGDEVELHFWLLNPVLSRSSSRGQVAWRRQLSLSLSLSLSLPHSLLPFDVGQLEHQGLKLLSERKGWLRDSMRRSRVFFVSAGCWDRFWRVRFRGLLTLCFKILSLATVRIGCLRKCRYTVIEVEPRFSRTFKTLNTWLFTVASYLHAIIRICI